MNIAQEPIAYFDRKRLITRSGLKPTERFVLHTINDYCSGDGTGAFPKQQTIANDTGYSRQTVNCAIKKLEAKKIITQIHNYREHVGGRRNSNYVVHWPELETLENSKCQKTRHRYVKKTDNISTHSDLPIKEIKFIQNEQNKAIQDESAVSNQEISFSDSFDQGAVNPEPNGQDPKVPSRVDTVPRSSKKPNKRGARPNDLAYDKNGWLQLPSGRAHKLPRWLAYRWMQLTLAVDYLDFEVVGIAPDDQPVLQTRDGLMTANYAFGDRDNSGQYPLKQLRDCAAVDRGQSHVLSQGLYNEALEDYFEQCSKWCKDAGDQALAIIERQTALRMVGFWESEYDDMQYSWSELDGYLWEEAA